MDIRFDHGSHDLAAKPDEVVRAMPDPKPRSSYLPMLLIIVGLVVCAGVVLAIVPVMECKACNGLGYVTMGELRDYGDPKTAAAVEDSFDEDDMDRILAGQCSYCADSGHLSFYENSFIDEGERGFYGDHMLSVADLRRILEARQSP